MSLIYAYKGRGIQRDITIYDVDNNIIVPDADDLVRIVIGRDGETAKLTVTSGTTTAAGSYIIPGALNRLRLDASDLNFDVGVYSMSIEYYDYSDATEWKTVGKEIFALENPTGQIADISEVLLEAGLSATVTEEERAIASTVLMRTEGIIKRYLGYDPTNQSHTEFYPQQAFNAQQSKGVWDVGGDKAVLEQLSEASSNQLQLIHIPIRSITHLYIDYDGHSGAQVGAFAADTEKVEGTDFWPNYDMLDSLGAKVCSDGVLMSTGLWPRTSGTVKVVYVAGYTDSELHGQDAVIDASPILEVVIYESVRRIRRFFATKKQSQGFLAGNIVSESLGDYSYSLDGSSASQIVGGGELTPDSKEKLSQFRNWGFCL